jgi:hypothetical protein
MRWTISPRSKESDKSTRDARLIDLLCILALLVVIVGAWRYLTDSTTLPPTTTSYVVPSQNVRW